MSCVAQDTPPVKCEVCDPGPCWFPTYCAVMEQAEAWWKTIPPDHPLRIGPIGNLPQGWRNMGEAQLWNHIQRRAKNAR